MCVASFSHLEVEREGNPLVKLVSDCLLLVQVLRHRAETRVGHHRAYLYIFTYIFEIHKKYSPFPLLALEE